MDDQLLLYIQTYSPQYLLMETSKEEIWSFIAEWYDPLPQATKQYLLKYYPHQNQAEMYDMKLKRIFLKKSPCPPELSSEDYFIGSQIVLYSRDLKIVDYADGVTKQRLSRQIQTSVLVLPADTLLHWGTVINDLLASGFNISYLKTISVDKRVSLSLAVILGESESSREIASISSSREPCLVLRVHKENAVRDLADLARSMSKKLKSTVLVPKDSPGVESLLELLVDTRSSQSTATLDSCTCCIIKPHAVKSKQLGQILDAILAQGFTLSAATSLHFSKAQAEEFLEVYRGVTPDFHEQVLQLSSGLCVALELQGARAVEGFREVAGPWDVEMAKELRPNTLRALYGVDNVRNAVHCTDLETDGATECEYIFKIISSSST